MYRKIPGNERSNLRLEKKLKINKKKKFSDSTNVILIFGISAVIKFSPKMAGIYLYRSSTMIVNFLFSIFCKDLAIEQKITVSPKC